MKGLCFGSWRDGLPARFLPYLAFLLIPILTGTAITVTAETATLRASKDNTLFQDEEGDLSNGQGNYIFAGKTDKGLVRRALIAFDVSGAVPSGSVVQSASLTLYMSRTKSRAENILVHKLLMDWGEQSSHANGEEGAGAVARNGDATWLHRFYPDVNWTAPGAAAGSDYVESPSANASVNKSGPYTWSSPQLAADVQSWVNTPGSGFGWILKGNESPNQTAKRFESRESTEPSRRPLLEVVFTPPASTGSCCLPGGDCVVTTPDDCAVRGGDYHGDGSSCTPNPCPQPPATGACCFDNGGCEILTAPECAARGGAYQGDDTACGPNLCPVVLTPFVDPLPLPAVAEPASGTVGGEARYEMVMTELSQKLHRDLPPTTVWGFNGGYPGPTLEAARGSPITVEWINALRDETGAYRTNHFLPVDTCPHGPDHEGDTPRTVVHLHGGHVPPESDGYPEATFLPGESVAYVYPNNQPAATLWYHDHALGITRLNVYMGLAGFYLLRDAEEANLDIPKGEYEVPIVIQDRRFREDGSLQYPAQWQEHYFGDKMLVNGKVWPYLEVAQGKYHFRAINGCNSRTLALSLSNGGDLIQIATDGGYMPAPAAASELTIAPGERVSFIVDFEGYPAGTEIILNNSAPAPFPGVPGMNVIPQVMKFIVRDEEGFTRDVPPALVPVPPLPEQDAVVNRQFILRKQQDPCTGSAWLINDLAWDDITEFPVLGTTEVWSFINRSGVVHPMHMHLVLFQVLDRQAFEIVNNAVVPVGPIIPAREGERGWKDTVQSLPGEITRVIMRFDDYTGLYPYHCHVLEHEDHEMMRQFRVVPPPRFLSIETIGSDIFLRLAPTPFHENRVQVRTGALDGQWTVWTNFTPLMGGAANLLDEGALAQPQRYYRIEVEP